LKYFKPRQDRPSCRGFLRSEEPWQQTATPRKQASADGDSGVHRLRDIVVEEVC
jgi:hypothetical protein